MKKIEQPFAMSAYSKMEDACTKYELACKKFNDLKMIRDKISKGQMNEQLYDFINVDRSLENLLGGLPKPCDGMACESLTQSQLAILDATIAEEALNLKEIVQNMWEAIKEWFLDWWDRSRWMQRDLRYMLGQWRTNPGGIFGDTATFGSTRVLMYRHDAWNTMKDAAKKLNESTKKLVDGAKLDEWVELIRTDAAEPLRAFGKHIDENCVIRQGQPTYLREENTCNNMRWRFNEIGSYLEEAINLLGNEIDIRREFNKLEAVFTKGNPEDRRQYMFARRIVYNAKENSMVVARTLRVMLNQVIRARSSMYKINQH